MAIYHTSSGNVAVAEHLLHCADAVLAGCRGEGYDAGGLAERRASMAVTWGKLLSKRLSLSVRAKRSGSLLSQLKELPENVRYEDLFPPPLLPPPQL